MKSYLKIGDLAEIFTRRTLGDRDGARRSYEKALALLHQSKNPNPVLVAETKVRLADLLTQRNPKEALAMYDSAVAALDTGAGEERSGNTESTFRNPFEGGLCAKAGRNA